MGCCLSKEEEDQPLSVARGKRTEEDPASQPAATSSGDLRSNSGGGGAIGGGGSAADKPAASTPQPVPDVGPGEMPEFKLLLLGAGDSGKSTFFRQLRIEYGEGFTEEERAAFVDTVHAHIVLGFAQLCNGLERMGPLSDDLKEAVEPFRALAARPDERLHLTPQDGETLAAIWQREELQNAWKQRTEWQTSECLDSLSYFLNSLERVTAATYIPSVQDIVNVRAKTTGIVKLRFEQAGAMFQVIDVGGQRSERRKWQAAFQGVHAVLFFAPLSEFDQSLYEDTGSNRMHDSLTLFESLCGSPYLKDSLFILILNKDDIFHEKVDKGCQLRKCFPEYEGAQSAEAFGEFIRNRFLAANADEGRKIYVNMTNCTNASKMRLVFESIRELVFLRHQYVPNSLSSPTSVHSTGRTH